MFPLAAPARNRRVPDGRIVYADVDEESVRQPAELGLVMIIIAETRYSGIYEGGRWAAFGLPREGFGLAGVRDLPPEAFGGDNQACEWWTRPTTEVEVGDTPNEANERLGLLRSYAWTQGLFVVGDAVRLAESVPDDWYGPEPGVVTSVDELAAGPGSSHRVRQWIYSVRFADSSEHKVPQRYLRAAPHSD